MNPYVSDVLAKQCIEQLRREAARYRLGRQAARRRMPGVWRPRGQPRNVQTTQHD